MAVKSFRDLTVWQRAMELVVECYGLAAKLPRDERFGLTSQLQRAAVSIPANIVEGHGRAKTQAYVKHLSIATGSLTELQTLIETCNATWVHDTDGRQDGIQPLHSGRANAFVADCAASTPTAARRMTIGVPLLTPDS